MLFFCLAHSRSEHFLEVKDLLDVIDVLLPGSVARLAVFFRHFAQKEGQQGRGEDTLPHGLAQPSGKTILKTVR